MIVAISEVFSFREDWHRDDRARLLVRQYQLTLDAVLRDRSDLQDCAVQCCHCGIRFFTHPRNKRRQDLRCPFGCRKHHQRQHSNERSRRHSQKDAAKRKKKLLNGKRSQSANTSPPSNSPPENAPLPEKAARSEDNPLFTDNSPRENDSQSRSDSPSENHAQPQPTSCQVLSTRSSSDLELDGVVLEDATLANSPILPHVCMVVTVLERRNVGRKEVIAALRKHMRQRSIGRRARREYVLRYLHRHPP